MIERAFHAYTTAVGTAFKAIRCPPTTRGRLVKSPRNKADHLRVLVEQLEEGHEFSALLEKTRSAFCSDWHSSKNESSWRHAIQHFFRRTGYYTGTFAGSNAPCDLVHRYKEAFQRSYVQTTYLAPVEFVAFPKSAVEFSEFAIRRLDRNELDAIVGNDVNRVFYPYAIVDTHALQEYWFIVVTTRQEAPRLGWINVDLSSIDRVSPEYTRFPCAVEDVLARLVLFDWVVAPQDDDLPYLGFNVPFVVRVDDNALRSPRSAPDCSTLVTTPQIDLSTGDEYESPIFFFNLNEPHVVAFKECIECADECLRHLLTDDTHWPFLKVAIGNLIKAFFADGLEQLLWHVTVLETLLGERKQGVATSLAGRIAALLGTTQNKKKELRKQFGKLYDLRCSLVHGSEFKEDIQRKQLFEARMMARRVMIWFVHYFGDIAARVNEGSWQSEVPKREDFLILLDLSDSDRVRLSALLSNPPTGFPTAPDWSR